MRSWRYVLIALEVFVLAIVVFLMVEGSILGARTTGMATLLGMVGIFIILVTYIHACKAVRLAYYGIVPRKEWAFVECSARSFLNNPYKYGESGVWTDKDVES